MLLLITGRYLEIADRCRTTAVKLVTVDARVAPHTSASKPCVRVSPHTAPQLLSPCHGCMQDVPCLVNPLLQQKKTICFFSSLPPCGVALSMRLCPSFATGCFTFPVTVSTSAYPLAFPEALASWRIPPCDPCG